MKCLRIPVGKSIIVDRCYNNYNRTSYYQVNIIFTR